MYVTSCRKQHVTTCWKRSSIITWSMRNKTEVLDQFESENKKDKANAFLLLIFFDAMNFQNQHFLSSFHQFSQSTSVTWDIAIRISLFSLSLSTLDTTEMSNSNDQSLQSLLFSVLTISHYDATRSQVETFLITYFDTQFDTLSQNESQAMI